MRTHTDGIEVVQGGASWSVVDQVAQREESECVKQLEDGVARLVDGHHHYPVLVLCQPTSNNKSTELILTLLDCKPQRLYPKHL